MTALDTAHLYREHGAHLRGLCYRMTGSAADADDLVQETFVRALTSPPAAAGSLRPWLTRVALNLGRDLLRARRRQAYPGPWLPSPMATTTDDGAPLPDLEPPTTEGRYDVLESVSYAFLLALEELTGTQRAVLILRDVLDTPVDETAAALGLSEANVKTTLHRARATLAAHDQGRRLRRPTHADREQNQAALFELFRALQAGDSEAMVRVLRRDVRAVTDGGGVYHAARLPIVGADKLALFLRKLLARRGPPAGVELRVLNALPALVVRYGAGDPRESPLQVVRCDLDEDGLIQEIHTIMAPRKLTALGLPG
ncbi:MAG: sigma-70 family RNA polymerase sigma factor [Myxococcales bacterium]|nr:MAG: sigma-70 family RNA polymerase sigma factor [Myxococcales bacterium]